MSQKYYFLKSAFLQYSLQLIMSTKLIIAVRQDIKLSSGKLCSQVGHAVQEAVLTCKKEDNKLLKKYDKDGSVKICVKAFDASHLENLVKEAENLGLITALIEDEGRTELDRATLTCCAIGPGESYLIDKVCKSLKLL